MLSFFCVALLAIASAGKPKISTTSATIVTDTATSTPQTSTIIVTDTATSTPQTSTIIVTDTATSTPQTSTTETSTTESPAPTRAPTAGFAYEVALDHMLMDVLFFDADLYESVSVEVVGHSVSGVDTGMAWTSNPVDVIVNDIEVDDNLEYMDFSDETGDFEDTDPNMSDFFFYLHGYQPGNSNEMMDDVVAAGSTFININDNIDAICNGGMLTSIDFMKPSGGLLTVMDKVATLTFTITMTQGCDYWVDPSEKEYDPTNYTVAACELISYHTTLCTQLDGDDEMYPEDDGDYELYYKREYFGHCESVCGPTQIIRTGTFGAESCGDGGVLSRDMTHLHDMKVLACDVGMFDFAAAPGLSATLPLFVGLVGALYRLL